MTPTCNGQVSLVQHESPIFILNITPNSPQVTCDFFTSPEKIEKKKIFFLCALNRSGNIQMRFGA
jgi:hypothetical protein